tara:strand:- start:442 stop:594 length:153 start_codon:yes stop_codon:yes gene_type:complete
LLVVQEAVVAVQMLEVMAAADQEVKLETVVVEVVVDTPDFSLVQLLKQMQ